MATATKTRKKKTKAPSVTVTIATFDDPRDGSPMYRAKRVGQPIGEHVPLTQADYAPRGNTPLRDATMSFIAQLADLRKPDRVTIGLLLDESYSMLDNWDAVIAGANEFVAGMADVSKVDPEAAGKVLAVILTDGLENASRETTPDMLRDEIARREAEGWTFIYLGSNQDAWSAGTSYGLSGRASGQTVTYHASPVGTASALRGATGRGMAYLGEHGEFLAQSAGQVNTVMAEDGSEKSALTGDPALDPKPTAKPYGNLADALNTAKGVTSK